MVDVVVDGQEDRIGIYQEIVRYVKTCQEAFKEASLPISIETRQTFTPESTGFIDASCILTARAVTTITFININAIHDSMFI